MNQRERRAKLLRDWEVAKRAVLERDRYRCLTCGRPATCVNHVLGRKFKKLFCDERYLISSCHYCNQSDVADTIQARRERLEILQNLYGYSYDDCPDKQYVGAE